jgi:hypothetical protein
MLTRNRFLALLIPGALWAFAHLGYITDPFYLRGIELTIAAVILEGIFFYKFDLTTTMVAHFAYNAGLTAFPLLRSSNPYFVFSGILVVAIILSPIVPGAIRALRRKMRGESLRAHAMCVSPATSADLDTLARFEIAKINWGDELANAANVVLCLRADDKVIGVIAAKLEENAARIFAVFVAPEWRRRYWGSVLVDELNSVLESRGVKQSQAMARVSDKTGMAFWASHNWFIGAQVFAFDVTPPLPTNWRERLELRYMDLKRLFGG